DRPIRLRLDRCVAPVSRGAIRDAFKLARPGRGSADGAGNGDAEGELRNSVMAHGCVPRRKEGVQDLGENGTRSYTGDVLGVSTACYHPCPTRTQLCRSASPRSAAALSITASARAASWCRTRGGTTSRRSSK